MIVKWVVRVRLLFAMVGSAAGAVILLIVLASFIAIPLSLALVSIFGGVPDLWMPPWKGQHVLFAAGRETPVSPFAYWSIYMVVLLAIVGFVLLLTALAMELCSQTRAAGRA